MWLLSISTVTKPFWKPDLLAVPNFTLKRPHHKRPHRKRPHLDSLPEFADLDYDLSDVLFALDTLEVSKPDEPNKEKLKWLKKVAFAIIKYHVIPHGLDAKTLKQNLTYPTDHSPHRARWSTSAAQSLRTPSF
jgi:hypothetical protein